MSGNLEIAQRARLRPIADVAADAGVLDEELETYGRHKAKVSLSLLDRLADRPDGKLVCVTAVTPTPAGEGKTTTSVALTQGLGRIGKRPVLCVREPSLGPVFGIKGGGCGGGRSQVVPMDDVNLHFTGDIHAMTAANNLLAAMLDAHLLHGNALDVDPLSITWRRCLDMNDRSLRDVVTGLGGRVNGSPRQTGFDITAASEVMGLVAASRDLPDMRARLAAITVGQTRGGEPVTAGDLGAAGSMAVLLRRAIEPNLVQTLEGQPALVHTGPFGNIALGNSSVVGTRVGLKLGEYAVTEGGFASDLGFEKTMDVVCRLGGFRPSAVVLVATVRALAHHGDGSVEAGAANLLRHMEIVRAFGLEPVVAVNVFDGDTDADVERVRRIALDAGAFAAERCDGFARGGEGAEALAAAVVEAAARPNAYAPVYELDQPLAAKIEAVARRVYGADGIALSPAAQAKAAAWDGTEIGRLPICMAKTHLSLSHDPSLRNAPTGFTVPVRDLRPYTGAGWVVALCGDVQTMPGLGARPAALAIDVGPDGSPVGIF